MKQLTYKDFDNSVKNYPTPDGRYGEYGGQYLPPELEPAFKEIDDAYETICHSAQFISELRRIRREFQGRPTPVYHCERLSHKLGKCQIYLKREDLNHTGAHKLNHCMGEGLLAKYMGKKKADRGDRRGPAWRGARHGGGLFRPRVRRVHGRGGHQKASAERDAHEDAGRAGHPGLRGAQDAQGGRGRGV